MRGGARATGRRGPAKAGSHGNARGPAGAAMIAADIASSANPFVVAFVVVVLVAVVHFAAHGHGATPAQ